MILNILIVLFMMRSLARTRRELVHTATTQGVQRVEAEIRPLLDEARAISEDFDSQLREKHRMIRELNRTLDKRIASLTLLVNRAEAVLKEQQRMEERKGESDPGEAALRMSDMGEGAERIADRLGKTEGEIQLILDLRKKLDRLAENGG